MGIRSRNLLVSAGWMAGGILLVALVVAGVIVWATNQYTIGFHVKPWGFANVFLIGAALGHIGHRLWGAFFKRK